MPNEKVVSIAVWRLFLTSFDARTYTTSAGPLANRFVPQPDNTIKTISKMIKIFFILCSLSVSSQNTPEIIGKSVKNQFLSD